MFRAARRHGVTKEDLAEKLWFTPETLLHMYLPKTHRLDRWLEGTQLGPGRRAVPPDFLFTNIPDHVDLTLLLCSPLASRVYQARGSAMRFSVARLICLWHGIQRTFGLGPAHTRRLIYDLEPERVLYEVGLVGLSGLCPDFRAARNPHIKFAMPLCRALNWWHSVINWTPREMEVRHLKMAFGPGAQSLTPMQIQFLHKDAAFNILSSLTRHFEAHRDFVSNNIASGVCSPDGIYMHDYNVTAECEWLAADATNEDVVDLLMLLPGNPIVSHNSRKRRKTLDQ